MRRLIWYKALPALLAVLVGWLLAAVLSKDANEERREKAQGQGGQGADDSGSWWGASGNGKAKLKNEVPKGATGAKPAVDAGTNRRACGCAPCIALLLWVPSSPPPRSSSTNGTGSFRAPFPPPSCIPARVVLFPPSPFLQARWRV